MKESKELIYRCNFCNKPMFNKGAMSLHERMCNNNPKNRHKCFFYCKYLEKNRESILDEYGDFIEIGHSFHCKKRGLELYSYKLERFNRNKYRMKDKKRMPLKCDNYIIENGHHKEFK